MINEVNERDRKREVGKKERRGDRERSKRERERERERESVCVCLSVWKRERERLKETKRPEKNSNKIVVKLRFVLLIVMAPKFVNIKRKYLPFSSETKL
jgi:hypothetical protein